MGIKRFSEEIHEDSLQELNTMPVMNLFVILIPFLLITTVFVETVVFDLHLPKVQKNAVADQDKTEELLLISLSDKGITIGIGQKFSEPIKQSDLKERLKKLKGKFVDREDIILVSEPKMKYEQIIAIMDVCAETGFSRVSLSGNSII